MHDFLQHAKDKPDLLKYLPEECDWLHIDRDWLCNVLYTLDKDGIEQMIKLAKLERKEKLESS